MGKIISKNHEGKEIIIGDLSVKKNHNPKNRNEMVTVLKIYHAGPGSEEDFFVFHFNPLLKDWILQVDKSFICIDMLSNHRLLEDIYSKIKPGEVINIQEFTDLICDEHFDIFVEANTPTKAHKFPLAGWIKKLFRRKEI